MGNSFFREFSTGLYNYFLFPAYGLAVFYKNCGKISSLVKKEGTGSWKNVYNGQCRFIHTVLRVVFHIFFHKQGEMKMFLRDAAAKRGLMLVLSSPSGAGKTTIARALLGGDEVLSLSVSKTTRAPRSGEVCGRDYFFSDRASFLAEASRGEFLEYAEVFGNYYGTPKRSVEDLLRQGKDVLFDVDWQGARQIKEVAPFDFVGVFILPPTLSVLAERLRKRATDSEDVILRRLNQARADMGHFSEYDYVLVNDDVERCIDDVRTILAAERLKKERFVDLSQFVQNMK